MNADNEDMEITLPILQSIEQQSDITQRGLAKRLGLALGLTNSYLKHCINKGLVKIEQIPANRYLYYLTPKGFAEKSRLATEYLSRSFNFYRRACASCQRVFAVCHEQQQQNIVLCGISDLAEIALLQAAHAELNVIGIYDAHTEKEQYLQYRVWQKITNLPENAVFIVTSLEKPQDMLIQLQQQMPEQQVLVPDILQL